jgi:hypothetical protein
MRIVENLPSIVRAGAGGHGRSAGPITQSLRTLQENQVGQFVLGEAPFENEQDFKKMVAKVRQSATEANLGWKVSVRTIPAENAVYVRRRATDEVRDLSTVPSR